MKIAGVQMDVQLKEVSRNVEKMISSLRQTAAQGAALTIFPECAATGYCFESLEEARPFAEPIPGPITQHLSAACAETGTFAVFGLLECEDDAVYNAAVLIGPQGVVGSYRKVHLPFLGVDQFVSYGNRPFAVHNAGEVKIGMNICYDGAFPEAARCLTILGADLIALPTNWPAGAQCMAEHTINTRAMENGVYFAAVNRVGTERGFRFIGRSRICNPAGKTVAVGSPEGEEILWAEIDPQQARHKRVSREPGKDALDRLADRRPDMYGLLVQPHHLPRPGHRSPEGNTGCGPAREDAILQ